jgi:hypothetical protein
MDNDKLELRDIIALKAMEIIYVKEKALQNYKVLAQKSYALADSMLKERENKI